MSSQNIMIREESETDISAISAITLAAFQPLDISSHTEHFIIDALAHEGVPAEYFFVLPFGDSVPLEMVVFHEGFNAARP